MAPKDTVWPIQPHTSAKHEILSRYLKAWFPILGKYNKQIFYVDGFCGPGRYEGGEKGSPLIALDAALQQRNTLSHRVSFRFFEKHQPRLEHLCTELRQFQPPPNFDIQTRKGRFQHLASDVLSEIKSVGREPAPSFIFVDPFGFSDIPMEVIRPFLCLRSGEVLINLMVEHINRFLTHPHATIKKHVVRAFDSEACLAIADSGGKNRIEALRDLYQQQLSKSARYIDCFAMRGQGHRPLYFLFFATNNQLGHEKMKQAMWDVDPSGTYSFSDAKDPNQLELFEDDSAHKLKNVICGNFGNRKLVAYEELLNFVIRKTEFIETHLKTALSLAEDEGKILIDPLKSDGTPRRKGTFPIGIFVTFIGK